MWDVAFGLMSMSPAQNAYYGFLGGVSSSAIVLGSLYYNNMRLYIYPELVYKKSVSTLNSNEEIRAIMGGVLTAGRLKAYTQTNGRWSIHNYKPIWIKPSVNMIYIVSCGSKEATVSVEAVQDGMKPVITFLGAEIDNSLKSRVLIVGDMVGFQKHEAMKSNVTFTV
jgi:hypothetical protein